MGKKPRTTNAPDANLKNRHQVALNIQRQKLKGEVVGAATISLTERRQKYNTYALEVINIKQRNNGNVGKGDIQENNAN